MIHNSIEEYLEHTGQSERQFARKVKITQPYVSLLRRGLRRPSPEVAQRIEAVTGIPFRKLLLNEDDAA